MAQLLGKVIINFNIEVVTGLRVGGAQVGLKVGGLDQCVITDANGVPFIPGSSLKGKLRALYERKVIPNPGSKPHQCTTQQAYDTCAVCKVWGIGSGKETEKITGFSLTRLQVRDVGLDVSTISEEMRKAMGFPYTEVKWETAIDRRKGTALSGSLRQVERVPAGAVFRPAEFVFNIYEEADKDLLKCLFEAMALLEDDYLGGMGSRGYGKVKFENIGIWWNTAQDYETGTVGLTENRRINDDLKTPHALVQSFDTLKAKLT